MFLFFSVVSEKEQNVHTQNYNKSIHIVKLALQELGYRFRMYIVQKTKELMYRLIDKNLVGFGLHLFVSCAVMISNTQNLRQQGLTLS